MLAWPGTGLIEEGARSLAERMRERLRERRLGYYLDHLIRARLEDEIAHSLPTLFVGITSGVHKVPIRW